MTLSNKPDKYDAFPDIVRPYLNKPPQPDIDASVLEILGDLVGKTLDHSQRRMPGEAQMYKMYIEKTAQAIYSLLASEAVGYMGRANAGGVVYSVSSAPEAAVPLSVIKELLGIKELEDKVFNEYMDKWDGSAPKSNVGDKNE